MKKSDKKIDRAIREALTEVCEIALVEIAGFQWITHLVNFDRFPASLSVVCVFDTDDSLNKAIGRGDEERLRILIRQHLTLAGFSIADIMKRVRFDTEEACSRVHKGNWVERLASH